MFASKDTLLTRPSGYNIARSVRLRSSATAYFNRTPAGSGNTTTWTISAWVKRGSLGGTQRVFSGGTGATTYGTPICFSSDVIDWLEYNGGAVVGRLITTQVFRDPSAWYHIVCVWDSTNATSTNRMRMYVNGVQVTAFSTATYPSSSASSITNNASSLYLGAINAGGLSQYLDGYLTEINFIDGQALTPSSFGETDSITGVWKPKAYSGTYGTNGFELNFSDNSNNTAATIGKDYSGNGNNWTPNNISVTAGATYDSMVDSPTVGSLSSNYAVWNPVDVNGMTISQGNLFATSTGATWKSTRSSMGMTSGKWYCEISVTANSLDAQFGVGSAALPIASYGEWTNANPSVVYSAGDGSKWLNASNSAYGGAWSLNDVIGCAFDADALTVTFYKNNVSQGTITTGWSAGLTWMFELSLYGRSGGSTTAWVNFGQRPFAYTPPTGYVALNTYNLPASTIKNGAAYMAATTYTGTGSAQNITNSGSFQPDFVWIKNRGGAYGHGLVDSVRGRASVLYSNDTASQGTSGSTQDVTAFNSNGFALGTNSQIECNASGQSYIGWQWKAGGTSASNTNGSITSTVSVGATQGFSVVTYTGTGANATVGHGLGVAPSMMIVKNRSAAEAWDVYHVSIGATGRLFLNRTDATNTSIAPWNNTAPTSTVFSLGTATETNQSASLMLAYCFAAVAGYSSAFSYTGNGSSDGPFVYLGFRPRWIMVKKSSDVSNWQVLDSSRSPYNLAGEDLLPNASDAEKTIANGFNQVDMLSNGFKIRNTNCNDSGGTYIGFAFAESPFKTSLAR